MNEGKHIRHNTGQFSCTVTEERLELGQVVHFAVGVFNVYEYTKNFPISSSPTDLNIWRYKASSMAKGCPFSRVVATQEQF